jgi:hypothetical protein
MRFPKFGILERFTPKERIVYMPPNPPPPIDIDEDDDELRELTFRIIYTVCTYRYPEYCLSRHAACIARNLLDSGWHRSDAIDEAGAIRAVHGLIGIKESTRD